MRVQTPRRTTAVRPSTSAAPRAVAARAERTAVSTYQQSRKAPVALSAVSNVRAVTSGNPITPKHIQIGYNVLSNLHKAEEEYAKGARFFLSMDDVTGAQAFKRRHPDAIVMVRVYLGRGRPSPSEVADRLGVGPNDPGLIYTGINENDSYDQTPQDMVARARFDLELAALVKQRSGGKAKFAAGTFSMGTPDFTSDEVCRQIRDLYSAAYNRGDIVFDMHTYSPDVTHIDKENELKWFERRWEFLFTKCGFDPNVRGIYSGETGLDEGGVGGFVAHDTPGYFDTFKANYQQVYGRPFQGGYQEFVAHWVSRFQEISARPLVVNGVSYPSPFIGGALFQLGNSRTDGQWDGYGTGRYVDAIGTGYAPHLATESIKGQKGEAPLGGGTITPPPPPPPPTTGVTAEQVARLTQYAGRFRLGAPLGTALRSEGVVFARYGSGPDAWGGTCAIADGANGPKLVRNDFYKTWDARRAELGAPRDEEHTAQGVVMQRFDRGTLTWTAQNGVQVQLDTPVPPGPVTPGPVTPGPVTPAPGTPAAFAAAVQKYLFDSGLQLGTPGAVSTVGGVRRQLFSGGRDSFNRPAVVAQGPNGPQMVRAGFYDTWKQASVVSRLGAPLDVEHSENGKVVQRFERGMLTWTQSEGVRIVAGTPVTPPPAPPPPTTPVPPTPTPGQGAAATITAFVTSNGLRLGQPTSGAVSRSGVTLMSFAGGPSSGGRPAVVALGRNGPQVVMLGFHDAYVGRNAVARLGAPLGMERSVGGKTIQEFERGQLEWSPSTGVVVKPLGTPTPVRGGSVYTPYEFAPGVQVNSRLGAHWFSTTNDQDMGRAQQVIDRMKALGAGYTTLLVDPSAPMAQANLIRKLQANGITPIVRLYVHQTPDRWTDAEIARQADAARQLQQLGITSVQVGNEPNLEGHLTERGITTPEARATYVRESALRLAQTMLAVRQACGPSMKIGVPPVAGGSPDSPDLGSVSAETYFPQLVRAIKSVEQSSGQRIADWVATHPYTYAENHGARALHSDGPRAAKWFEATAATILGRPLKSLATESGAVPADFMGDGTNPQTVRMTMLESLEQMKADASLTGCLWLLSGAEWQQHALWNGEGAFATALDAYRQAFANR